MLRRSAEWLPKLLSPDSSNYALLFSNQGDKVFQEAAYGLVDIQELYDLDISEMINGTLKAHPCLLLNNFGNTIYQEYFLWLKVFINEIYHTVRRKWEI